MIRANKARSNTEKRGRELPAIVSSSDGAIVDSDLAGTVMSWNKSAQNLYGYTAQEIIGQPIATVIPEHLREENVHLLQGIASGQLRADCETVRRRKDGSRVHVSLIVSPVRNTQGRIIGASTIAYDITERKRRQECEHLAAVVESSDDAIIGKSLDGTITHWNPGAADLFGYSAFEAVGKPIQILVPPERINEESDTLARIRNGLRVKHFETVRVRKDGTQVSVSVTISPIRDRLGTVVGASQIARDITERKCAEEELRKSEDRFSKAFRQSPVAITISTEAEGRYLDANESFLLMTGYARADVIGHRSLDLAFWVLPALRLNLLRQLQEGGDVTDLHMQYRNSTGEIREAELSWERVEVEGHPCLLSFMRDVTERMRSEKSLREYERVVEGLIDMIVVVDRDYRYVIANRSFLNYRGLEREQVIGHRVDEVLEKETFESVVKEKMDECFAGKLVQYELKYDSPGLDQRALFASYFPIAGSTGVDRIACVLRDITEHKQAEERLRKSEDRFSKAFRRSPLAITISTEGDGRYLDANESFLRMTGYTLEDVVSHTASEMEFWALPSLRTDLLRQLREGGSVTDCRMQFRTSTAETREAELSWEKIEVAGQPCLLAFMRDITETQRLEAQFLQAQKMEAVGRLAGGVAHDFNNMLSVIIGYSDLAVDLVAPESSVMRYLVQIKQASERAALLTRQLLAFSRRQIVFPRILDLNNIVNNLATMLLRMVGDSISVSFHPTTPLGSIKADACQIEQLLMNLVVNARDAMPRGGTIIIETAHAQLDEHYVSEHAGSHAGRQVVLAISDNGCGMDESIKSKIFEPFFTTKGIGQGTGLGLSTVYGIVTQSNASICVDSQVGIGTTFKIYFPRIAEKAQQLVQSLEADDVISGSETILLVEDDDSVRQVTASLLTSAGYRVIEASNAEKAVEIVTARGPGIDLLLTDLIMFGQSGFDLFEQAKVIRPGLRSLFMSGYTGDLVALRGGSISERAFLSKPFTRISLLKKVHSVLHGE